jgi:NAD(P)-dependent dehydrogenase (short-subunit alcohol dehydrogenase family)
LNNMPFASLNHKLVIITGASSGIGRSCAISCSKLGASVVLIGRNPDKLQSVLSELEKGDHSFYSVDLTHYDELEKLVSTIVDQHGKISGFIHSAGTELTLPLNAMKPQLYEKLFSINVIAGFEFVKYIVSKKNIHEEGASIVFIASVMSILGQPAKIAYCSSKGAIVSAVKAMALELAQKKVRVNAISPGIVRTPLVDEMFKSIPEEAQKSILDMHPLGIGLPEDVANACAFLLSENARWITGTNLIIDGGYSAK